MRISDWSSDVCSSDLKRRHRGATIQLSNIPYIRGSQGPDLATIPSIAIGQLEVLRDGASANYGSDAIAGVLNFRLRDDREGATFIRSDERCVGKAGVSTCRSRWLP